MGAGSAIERLIGRGATGTVIGLVCLIAVASWMVWPTAEDAAMGRIARIQQRRMAEMILLQHMPTHYLDTLDLIEQERGFTDQDCTAIYPPGVDLGPGVEPMWKGTLADLRLLLQARRELERRQKTASLSALPETETR